MPDEQEKHWTLDRRVPIALIIVLTVQFGSGIWFMSKLDSRVSSLEDDRKVAAPQSDRITRLEVNVEVVKDGVAEIKRLLRKDQN